MALADNLAFLHLCNAETPDYPISGGTWTASAPGALAKAVVAGAGDTYFNCATGNAIRFEWSGGEFFEPGLGSFTIAAKLRAITFVSGQVHIAFGEDTSRTLIIMQDSSVNRVIGLSDESTGVTSQYLNSTANIFPADTDFIVVFGRDVSLAANAQGFCYINGATNLASENAAFDTRDWGGVSFDGSEVTLGSLNSGLNEDNSRIYWISAWGRALTSTEITTNMNETDLGAMVGGGSFQSAWARGSNVLL